MKKLLLLLLLSLAYIGSANANSIQGGFGYKLGQAVPSAEILCNVYACGHVYVPFKPVNQIPPFDSGYFEATLNEKKIYKIHLSYSEDSTKENPCFNQDAWNRSHFAKILKILEARYGDFERSWWRNSPKDTQDRIEYSYDDGNRSIIFGCYWKHEKESFFKPYEGSSELKLMYFDRLLRDLAEKERKEYKKKKTLEKSSDYDL